MCDFPRIYQDEINKTLFWVKILQSAKTQNNRNLQKMAYRDYAHTTGNCKYRIVFAQKYHHKVFYGSKKNEIVQILNETV